MEFEKLSTINKEVADLSEEMYGIKIRLQTLTEKYHWKSEQIVERLAAQILSDIENDFEEMYKKINHLERNFKS